MFYNKFGSNGMYISWAPVSIFDIIYLIHFILFQFLKSNGTSNGTSIDLDINLIQVIRNTKFETEVAFNNIVSV